MKQKTGQILGFIVGVALAIGLDQWTKYLAVAGLKGKDAYVIWDGVFELQYLENRGAAFGMMQGKQFFFFVVAAVVIIAAAWLLWRMPVSKRYLPLLVCLCLVVAGAIGNMIDRVSLGYVVDFLYFKLIDFPIFNVADCYVTVATAAAAVLIMFSYKEEELAVFARKGGKGRKPEEKTDGDEEQ